MSLTLAAVLLAACKHAIKIRAKRDFGSIWAVGLPVCPPVRLPSLACTRAPRKPRPCRRPSRLFRPAARRLPPVPAARLPRATVRPSKPRPWSHIATIRLLYIDFIATQCRRPCSVQFAAAVYKREKLEQIKTYIELSPSYPVHQLLL